MEQKILRKIKASSIYLTTETKSEVSTSVRVEAGKAKFIIFPRGPQISLAFFIGGRRRAGQKISSGRCAVGKDVNRPCETVKSHTHYLALENSPTSPVRSKRINSLAHAFLSDIEDRCKYTRPFFFSYIYTLNFSVFSPHASLAPALTFHFFFFCFRYLSKDFLHGFFSHFLFRSPSLTDSSQIFSALFTVVAYSSRFSDIILQFRSPCCSFSFIQNPLFLLLFRLDCVYIYF